MVKFSDDGFVELLFNMNIYVDDEMNQFLLRTEYRKPEVRYLEKRKKVFDLSKYLKFSLISGNIDSDTDPIEYAFSVEIDSFKSNSILLHFIFENPLLISSGDLPDEMVIEFIDTSLFVSSEFGQTLPSGLKM